MNARHPTIAALEEGALAAHLTRQDKFTELGEMPFRDLLSLEDDLSEGGDWSTLDDVRREIRCRQAEAIGALSRHFVDAIAARGAVPMVIGAKLAAMPMHEWLGHWAMTADGADKAREMLFDAGVRPKVMAALSVEYAKDNCDELLRAGWTS